MAEAYYSLKKLLLAYTFAYAPFSLIAAILSLAGLLPVNFNGQHYYGISGFIITILTIPFVAIVFGVINRIYLNLGVFVGKKVIGLFKKSEER
jgi:hypothetical protein